MNQLYSYSQLLDEVGSNVERLAYIDFKLKFTGFLRRSDMKDTFGLAEAAASRMLTLYSEYRPNNFFYDRVNKVNTLNDAFFEPLFPIDAETALGMLSHGFNKNKLLDKPILPYARIGRVINSLNAEDISKITRAMYGGHAIEACYISSNSDKHDKRVLVPLAIINDGKNWIFRAYDRSSDSEQKEPKEKNKVELKFKNFNFSRVMNIAKVEGENGVKRSFESLQEDSYWNTSVPILLKIHNKLSIKHKKTIRRDFGLSDDQDIVVLSERPALIWILTKIWNIDVGKPEECDKYFKFELTNIEMIKDYI